jgi:hypothetical protein
MSRHYANYRVGGKTENKKSVAETGSNEEINSAKPELRMEEIKNQDSLTISDRRLTVKSIVVPLEKNNIQQNSISKNDSSFVMDEELLTAYTSAAFNGLTGLFGFLTLVSPNTIWFAAPLYIGSIVFSFIGIICFFMSLIRFFQDKIAERNKKYYFLWVIVFGLSFLFALIPLLMIL